MRAPQNTLATALVAGLATALITFLGGTAGVALKLRDLRRRVEAMEDDHEAIGRRIARRDGEKGRAIAQERKSREEEEIARIVAHQGEEGDEQPSPRKRNGAAKRPVFALVPDWAHGVLG